MALMGISMGGRDRITAVENALGEVIYPIQGFFMGISDSISNKFEPLANMRHMAEKNEKLEEELIRVKRENIELTLNQKELNTLKDLKQALNFVDTSVFTEYITCNITSKTNGNWYDMYVIDVGLNDGITRNSTVVSGDGLVGFVYEVSDNWSKAITIINNKSTISFEIKDAERDYDGRMYGSSKSILRGQIFDPKADIRVGDSLMTSGIGMHPRGIPIGVVSSIINNKDDILPEIIIEPFVDFNNVDTVMIIPNKKDQLKLKEIEN
jgi:rod shape-determining protein MreC